ncbi:MAG TPA: TIGR03118 family protein [Rhizomicrobium sp.]|nr:TIGR03118 family protein [Rhizomicrobium sp.]
MQSVLISGRAAVTAMFLLSATPAFAQYNQIDLVSNVPGMAKVTDPQLVNPWGMASSGTSPWWVSDNGTGLSTLYNGNTGAKQGLVVTVPPAAGGDPPSAPTGLVFNNDPSATHFVLPTGGKATFIFSSEDGTISAWNGAQGTLAVRMADLSGSGAVYKGLAIGTINSASFLYATDFVNGKVTVFNSSFSPTNVLPGTFTDPNLPANYSPFGIKNLGGKIYVTYAHSSGGKDEDHGAGLGLVDVFDTSGNFIQRVADTGGPLDAPWGLLIAPSNFGPFSDDLLVGNFGNGTIDAFDPNSYAFLGQLLDNNGNPISIDGLWDLGVGNGASGGPKNAVFFTAGINGENDGLFGELDVPEPFTLSVFGVGLAGAIAMRRRKAKSQAERDA